MSKLKLSKTDTFTRAVTVRLPTGTAGKFIEGQISYTGRIKSKEDLAAMADQGKTDLEYIDEVITAVDGLVDDNDNAITGEAAMHEVTRGLWSTYLTGAILQDYFDQFTDARVKNSKPSRGR